MARQIPEVVRAVAGLAATVLDEARKLPETLFGLPVRLIGQALQTSLKLQQQYSGLVARGDEVFTGLRGDAEPGMATFDEDDVSAPLPAAGARAARSSAFDRVADLPTDTVAEELADDLAVAELPVADADDLSDEASAAVLAEVIAEGAHDMSQDEVAALPDDPIADAVTAVVDELAAEVADEVAAEMPEVVPDEVLEDLTADTVAEVADDEVTIEEAVAEELIAEPVAAEATPAEPGDVLTLDELTSDEAPEQTRIVEDAVPDVAALEDAAEELVDLGGPEAAESVTPDNPITDSAASDPLVAPEPAQATGDEPTGDRPTPQTDGDRQVADEAARATENADQPTGDQPAQAASDQPTGDEPTGDRPAPQTDGDRQVADEATRATEEADQPTGDQPAQATGDEPTGDRPAPQTDGDQQVADEAARATEEADQPTGDQPAQATDDGDHSVADTAAADGADTAPASPVEGYESFSIPALRGRLRAYPTDTVADLLDYERATQGRPPYVTLLQNRLEKLSRDRG
jgi:hypothetical protein